MNFVTRLRLAPRLRMSGARPLLPLAFMAYTETNFPLSSVTMVEPKTGKVTRNGYLKIGMLNVWFSKSKMSKLVEPLVSTEVENV